MKSRGKRTRQKLLICVTKIGRWWHLSSVALFLK